MQTTMDQCNAHVGVRGSKPRAPRVLVIGLGNDLMKDDGIGLHVVRELKGRLPHPCKVVEVGTAVLDALHLFEWADIIIAIDAMQAGLETGTLYRLEPSASDLPSGLTSMHEMTFLSALTLIRNRPKEIIVFGVEPEQIEFGLELSRTLQAVVAQVAETVSATTRERLPN